MTGAVQFSLAGAVQLLGMFMCNVNCVFSVFLFLQNVVFDDDKV